MGLFGAREALGAVLVVAFGVVSAVRVAVRLYIIYILYTHPYARARVTKAVLPPFSLRT